MSDTDPNALLRLRNGTQAPRGAVMTSWIAVKRLADSGDLSDLMALAEARELARDPSHALFPGTAETLREYSLTDEAGKMHDITRDVILSSFPGDEMDLSLTWPVDAPETAEDPS